MAAVFLAETIFSTAVIAATLEVCPEGPPLCAYSAITEAAAHALDGDTILVHDGRYTENIILSGRALTLSSVNGPGATTIDGSSPDDPADGSVLRIVQGSSITLTGLTLEGGLGSYKEDFPDATFGGAVLVEDSALSMNDCVVTGNSASVGGGIFTLTSDITVTSSTFTGNDSTTPTRGAALEGNTSTVFISGSAITGNGLFEEDDSSRAALALRFAAQSPVDPTLRSTLTIADSQVTDNFGKGISVFGRLEMTDSEVSRNSGRGVSVTNLDISRTLISDNRGGGLAVGWSTTPSGGSSTVEDCLITGNHTLLGGGGGIEVWYAEDVTISNSVISGNFAGGAGGGGIQVGYSRPVSVVNSLVAGNLTSGNGGAFYIKGYENEGTGEDDSAVVTVTNTTLAGNRAHRTGGVYLYRAAEATLVNSIVWGNDDVEDYPQLALYAYFNTPVLDVFYSDVQGGDPANPGLPWPGDGNIEADPGFLDPRPAAAAPAAGGDYHLTPCSGVIDAGTDDSALFPTLPSDDIDGIGRPWGVGYDLGAYESESLPSGNSGPLAVDDQAAADEDGYVEVPVLANDVFPGAGPQAPGIAMPPAHGTAAWNPNGTVTYTPAPNFNGTDVFFYSVGDGTCTGMAQVTVAVTPMPDPPFEVCPSGCEYSSIQEAIETAWHGDIVRVRPGNYVEHIDFLGKALTVESAEGPEKTVIDGGGGGPVVTFNAEEGPGSVLKGLTVTNGSAEKGAGIYIDGKIRERQYEKTTASPTILDCVVRDNLVDSAGAGIFIAYGSPLIEGSVIRDNICDGPTCNGGGIWFFEEFGYDLLPVIRRSVISGNYARHQGGGIFAQGGNILLENTVISGNVTPFYGGGIYLGGWTTAPGRGDIRHCTISGNKSGIFLDRSVVEITNSIVWGNYDSWDNGQNERWHNIDGNPDGEALLDFLLASVTVNFSDLPSHYAFSAYGEPWPGTGNINVNPGFVDPVTWVSTYDLHDSTTSEGNLHLSPRSPCIDAGTDDAAAYPWLPTDDIDGHLRPQGAGRDIGADEHVFKGDWNGNGTPDILWRHAAGGGNYLWYMNGITIAGGTALPAVNDMDWIVGAAGDFDGDGNPDLLWRNASTGENSLWHMNGPFVLAVEPFPSVGTDWRLAGTEDFDLDGDLDLLWRNVSTGSNYLWYLEDVAPAAGAPLSSAGPEWSVAALDDFNGDARTDILWRNAVSGLNYVWYLEGGDILGGASFPSAVAPWNVDGTADFNGDGWSDICWRNYSTGGNFVWFMQDSAVIGGAPLPAVADTDWHIE